MKPIEIRIIALLGLIIIGFIAIAQWRASQNGRYQVVQRENNRMMIIDTRTGRNWDSLNDFQIIERPPLHIQK